MFDLTYPKTSEDAPEPARALLTPVWVGALALLVANDHWLKGADLLPGVLTGKLSDFAGMIVAPTLLAALLAIGGLRGRRVLLACHVAVGAVFAGIQLSPLFAAQWSALMGVFGYPWLITCDPTDLIALPFLALSWKLLVPEMDASRPMLAPLQRTAVAGLSVFGLWSTVATSGGGPDWDDEWYEDVTGNVFVNNANDFEISLHVRPLRDDVEIDCDQISTDPGRLLSENAFGEAEHWLLPARTNVGIDFDPSRACGAAWVAGEGIEPTIVFADSLSLYPSTWFSGQTFSSQDLGNAGLAIEFASDGNGGSEWLGSDELRYTPRTDAPEQGDSCELPAGELRFDWPASVPHRETRVIAVEPGIDGCFELELQELNVEGDIGEPYGFYLCAPAESVPFTEGEYLRFAENYGTSGARELSVMLLDPASLVAQVNEAGMPIRQVRYLRGGNDPAFIGPAIGRTLVAVDSVGCAFSVDEGECATVERHVNLAVTGATSYLQPGEAVSFADQPAPSAMVRTAVLGYARQLAVIDQACAEGSLQLRYDIDLAVIEEPLQ